MRATVRPCCGLTWHPHVAEEELLRRRRRRGDVVVVDGCLPACLPAYPGT
jgi:hypothetical protein